MLGKPARYHYTIPATRFLDTQLDARAQELTQMISLGGRIGELPRLFLLTMPPHFIGHRSRIQILEELIPACIDHDPWAHSRIPMEMIFQGRSMSLFQASQQNATMSS